jgi:hypothetical protein
MAKFKVLRIDNKHTIRRIRVVKDEAGNKVPVEEFEDVVMKVGAYGHNDIKVGQVLELDEYFSEKARKNKEYFAEVPEKASRAAE